MNLNAQLIFDTIWYLALFFSIFWFITTDRKKMLIFGLISTFLFWISIFSYWWINWLFVSIISMVIKILSLKLNKEQLKYLQYSSPFIAIFLFLILPEWIEGIIPALSMFFITLADSQKDIIKMKYWYYWSNILWLLYWIILWSIPAILFDIFWFFAITYWIYKLKKINEKY